MSHFSTINAESANLISRPTVITTENGSQDYMQGPSIKRVLGLHEAESLAGPLLTSNLQKLEQMNPALGRSLIDNGFGSGANTSIGYREWAMLVMAVLITMGDTTDQLQVYLNAALKHGATETEIIDLTTLVSGFAGAPRSVNGIRAIAEAMFATHKYHLPGLQERVISLHDHNTLVRDSHGDGVPVILIHALSMDCHMWQEVFPQLAGAGRVISYDLRGHGQARGAPLTKSLSHLAEDLLELINILALDKIDVYGASYGGAVAQYFTLAYPERVRSLAVIASSSTGHKLLETRATRAEANGVESLLPESIQRWFLPETIARDEWMVRYARACHRRARVEDWAAAWRAMAALDCADRLPEIQVPVLVLAGTQDLSATPAIMKPTAEGCKYGEYRELNPGTHMMVMEQPEAASDELLAFRTRVNASSSL
ncbi:alpha/beta-hydrolase [Hyaloscypha variabilis]